MTKKSNEVEKVNETEATNNATTMTPQQPNLPEKEGTIFSEIQQRTGKKLLTAPPFFQFRNSETGETKEFVGKYVTEFKNDKIRNPYIFQEAETGNLWLLPKNYMITEVLNMLGDRATFTTIEIELIETKTLKGGNKVNVYRINALD